MIYVFCHVGPKAPSGGVKILFEMTQALTDNGYEAAILMPGAHLYPNDCPKDYKPSWFETTVPVFDDVRIVTKDDIVVMHEEGVWAFDYVMANKPRYLIINQGAQSSIANNVGMNITYGFVRSIYDGALGVITISPYISDFVHITFGVPREKIYHVDNMIDGYFQQNVPKTNNILVMMKSHSLGNELLLKVFAERYPNWSLEVISGYSHREVADAMARSKIFVFFASNQGEGSPLPPVEAAIAGCKVIGSSGVGGSFIFQDPIFTEVGYNDIVDFIAQMDTWTFLLAERTMLDFSVTANVQHQQLIASRSVETYRSRLGEVFSKILG